MEMIRTLIIALFFAAITVGTYYYLNNPNVSWDFLASGEKAPEVPGVMIEETEQRDVSRGAKFPTAVENVPPHAEAFASHRTQTAAGSAAEAPMFWDVPEPASSEQRMPQQDMLAGMEPIPLLDPNAILAAQQSASAHSAPGMPPSAAPAGHASGEFPELSMDIFGAPQHPEMSSQHPGMVEPSGGMTEQQVRAFLATAAGEMQKGNFHEVLVKLSPFYGDPRFSPQESKMLTNLLTEAATWVIFRKDQHILEPPYTVRPEDTLESIASAYNIPAEFIARINGVPAGVPLQPGTTLKVLRGPFSAKVYLDRYEMLLTIGGLYAVRFWIGVGEDLVQPDGHYVWGGKEAADYRGADQAYFFARDPNNPLGAIQYKFVSAGGAGSAAAGGMPVPGVVSPAAISIHASPEPSAVGRRVARGNIILSKTDLESLDVLLGLGSSIALCHVNPHAAGQNMQMAGGAAEGEVFSSSAPSPNRATPEGIMSPINTSMGNSVSMPGYSATDEMPSAGGVPQPQPGAAGVQPNYVQPGVQPGAAPNYVMPAGGSPYDTPAGGEFQLPTSLGAF